MPVRRIEAEQSVAGHGHRVAAISEFVQHTIEHAGRVVQSEVMTQLVRVHTLDPTREDPRMAWISADAAESGRRAIMY